MDREIHAPDFEFFCSRFLYFAPEIEIEILKLKLAISIPGACSWNWNDWSFFRKIAPEFNKIEFQFRERAPENENSENCATFVLIILCAFTWD